MRRSTACALAGILLLAVAVRLWPLADGLYWGADFGEYHRITADLVDRGYVSTDYRGWGTAYPYFPGMHVVQAMAAHSGLDLLAADVLLVPVLASLSVLLVFLLAVRLFHDDRVGLIAAAFLAVAMPHAYVTSHPIPGSLGDVLFGAALLALVALRHDRRWLGVLLPVTAALIVTHHFTTYFLILAAVFAVLLRILVYAREDPRAGRLEALYLTGLVTASFAYWALFATPFRDQIFPQVQALPWWALLLAFAAVVPLLRGLRALRPRWRWRYTPRDEGRAWGLRWFALGTAATVLFLAAVAVLGIPGTTIRPPWATIPLFAPLLALFALSAAGRNPAGLHRHGIDVTAWFLAFGLSAAVGAAIASTVLFPYRHMQYLMWPVALFAGLGAIRVFPGGLASSPGKLGAALVAVLLLAALPAAYPPRDLLAGHEEHLRPEGVNAAVWLRGSAWGLVASDHIGSTQAFGFGGLDATWDYAPDLLQSTDFAAARDAFENASFPAGSARVRFVLLTEDIVAGAMLYPWEPATPLTAAEAGKFERPPFQRVFDDGYSAVYYLNWGLT